MKTLEEIKSKLMVMFDNAFADGEDGRELREGDLAEQYANEAMKVIESTISQTKQELIEDKNTRDNRIYKEGFDAGYKKGRKDLIKQVKEWSEKHAYGIGGDISWGELDKFLNKLDK